MARRIGSDGQITQVLPADGRQFSLGELQAVVGGLIQPVYLDNGDVLLVNEEGANLGLPFNARATAIAREQSELGEAARCYGEEWCHMLGDAVLLAEAEWQTEEDGG